jgi:hypothetical protein
VCLVFQTQYRMRSAPLGTGTQTCRMTIGEFGKWPMN